MTLDKKKQKEEKVPCQSYHQPKDHGPKSEEEDPPPNQHKYGISAVSQHQI